MAEYPNIDTFVKALNVKSDDSLTLEKLLERAYDIRKFEIDLYWKRATYFWGFLIAAFTAYFIVSDPSKFASKPIYELLVVCIGFIFSLSWYLVNRGSLYWQSNWERMIEAIEESLEIDFYKSNLVSKNKVSHVFSWYPYSLGRINIMVSLFVCTIWFGLIILFFIHPGNRINLCNSAGWEKVVVLVITGVFACILVFKGKSPMNNSKSFSFVKRDINYKI
ncbi:MAG: hypothetical protein QM737_18650 [Ferruginibacter sp.]